MINKVILIGNVGADPDVKYIKENQSVAHINLATTETFVKNGEKTSNTEWHRLVLWGNLAKIAESYVIKGTQLYVEGKLHYSQYQDKNNETKYSTEIVVNEIRLLGGTKTNPRQQSQEQIDNANEKALNSLVNESVEEYKSSDKQDVPF